MPLHDLHGELLVLIVQHALDDPADNPLSRTKRLNNLASVNRRMRAAVTHHLSRRCSFMDSPIGNSPLVELGRHSVPWLPQIHADASGHAPYWRYHLGSEWDEVPSLTLQASWVRRLNLIPLKALSLDLRVKSFDRLGTRWGWNTFQVPQWIHGASALSRIAATSFGLEALHVRLPLQEDQITLLCDVLSNNPSVRDLVVEIDSALDVSPIPRPLLTLTDFLSASSGLSLERLVLRAPGCDLDVTTSSATLARLSCIKHFKIAASRFHGTSEPWRWVLQLLDALPQVETVEIAGLRSESPSEGTSLSPASCKLPHLTSLLLDLPAVDARLLRALQAPQLQHLAIRTQKRISDHGECSLNHFPSLVTVRIDTQGSIVSRLQLLGLPRNSYIHNFRQFNEEWVQTQDFSGDFVAEIKPDLRSSMSASPGRVQDASPRSLWLSSPHSPSALVLVPSSPEDPSSLNAVPNIPEYSTAARFVQASSLGEASCSHQPGPSTFRQAPKRARHS